MMTSKMADKRDGEHLMDNQQTTSLTYSFMTQVILLQSKAETSEEDLASLFKGVYALKQHIPCLIAVSAGENQSTHHRGFTHGILLHFENEERMRNAMQQPTYERMLKKAQRLSDVVVILELPEALPLPAPLPAGTPGDAPQAKRDRPQNRERSRRTPARAPQPSASTSPQRLNIKEQLRRHPVSTIGPRIKLFVNDEFR